MRRILLITTLLCGAAIPAMSAGNGKSSTASTGGSFTGATANLAPGDAPGQGYRDRNDLQKDDRLPTKEPR